MRPLRYSPQERIGEEVSEQLGIIPQKHYVIRTVRGKYACSCKQCMKTAAAPSRPLSGSQVGSHLLTNFMGKNFHDVLPLYRQEKSLLVPDWIFLGPSWHAG